MRLAVKYGGPLVPRRVVLFSFFCRNVFFLFHFTITQRKLRLELPHIECWKLRAVA